MKTPSWLFWARSSEGSLPSVMLLLVILPLYGLAIPTFRNICLSVSLTEACEKETSISHCLRLASPNFFFFFYRVNKDYQNWNFPTSPLSTAKLTLSALIVLGPLASENVMSSFLSRLNSPPVQRLPVPLCFLWDPTHSIVSSSFIFTALHHLNYPAANLLSSPQIIVL